MTAGCLAQAAGYALLELTVHEAGGGHDVAWLIPALAVVGAAMGLAYAPMFGIVLAGVDPQHASSASGLLSTVQQVGGATGIALAGIVSSTRSAPSPAPPRSPRPSAPRCCCSPA
jgi:predicted MFS family arabinose efflux permease